VPVAVHVDFIGTIGAEREDGAARFVPARLSDTANGRPGRQLFPAGGNVLPILGSMLVGVVAKLGIGLAASAAKRLFTSSSATAATEPARSTFAEELDRARPAAPVAAAASLPVAAVGPPPAAALAPPSAVPPAGAPGNGPIARIAANRSLRRMGNAAARPQIETPPLTTDPAHLALASRAGRRRAGTWVQRLGRHHLGAYRRLDINPR
jgi:hypothetical protein